MPNDIRSPRQSTKLAASSPKPSAPLKSSPQPSAPPNSPKPNQFDDKAANQSKQQSFNHYEQSPPPYDPRTYPILIHQLNHPPDPVIIQLPDEKTLELACTNSGNETIYPQSGHLYNEMCQKLGGNNVRPIPDYITSDNLRKKWLKRSENALLYFLHRKAHYRNELQKMADTSVCTFCCMPSPKSITQTTPCQLCCWETLSCGTCCWLTVADTRRMLYSGYSSSSENINQGMCCPCLTGTELLNVISLRLGFIGIIGMETNTCYSCLQLFFCEPCITTKVNIMIQYLYFKRYGKQRKWSSIINEAGKGCPKYEEYLKNLKETALHPVGQAQSTSIGEDGNISDLVTDRELPTQIGSTMSDWGHEYYHLKGALRAHNKHWAGYHRIEML